MPSRLKYKRESKSLICAIAVLATSWLPESAIHSSTLNETPLSLFFSPPVPSSVSLSLLSLSRMKPSPRYLSPSREDKESMTCSDDRLGPVKSATVIGETRVQHFTVTVVYNLLR